jgi:NitT/TauT family transport system substrate-binding protein
MQPETVGVWLLRHARIIAASLLLALGALAAASIPASAQQTIKVGTTKLSSTAPLFIAIDKGYFAAEGLSADVVIFDAAQPVSMGVTSGDLDFGVTAVSGAFYSLAAQGSQKIIAGTVRDAPGFQQYAFVVANRAYEAGLKSYKDLAGRSVAVVQVGGPIHYTLALIEEKYALDATTIRPVALQTVSNQVSAVTGGTTDAGIIPVTAVAGSIARGDMKNLGFTGDAVQWQLGALFASTKSLAERRDTVERFLRAYGKAVRDYHDAFIGPDEKRKNGPEAAELLAIVAKHLGQTVEQVEPALPYIDPQMRLDVQDVQHQLTWYKSEGMLKGDIRAEDVIDKSHVLPLSP